MAGCWERAKLEEKTALLNYAHSKGCSILVSVGGSTFGIANVNPETFAEGAANFVIDQNLDGDFYPFHPF